MYTILRKGTVSTVVEPKKPKEGQDMICPETVEMMAYDYRHEGRACGHTFYARNKMSEFYAMKYGKTHWKDLKTMLDKRELERKALQLSLI
jgi:hypothetical protein